MNNNESQKTSMPGRFDTRPCLLVYMDILGSKQFFEGPTENTSRYIRSLNEIYDNIKSAIGDVDVRMFSDDITLLTYDCNQQAFDSLIKYAASIEFDSVVNHRLILRGGLSNKEMYSDKVFCIGNGLIEAHRIESKIAKYPRIVLPETIDFCADSPMIYEDSEGHKYVNYLEIVVEDGFADDNAVERHRNSIVKMIDRLNENEEYYEDYVGMSLCEWERVKSKYKWLICYHNFFCKKYDSPYEITFKEEFDIHNKLIIKVEQPEA